MLAFLSIMAFPLGRTPEEYQELLNKELGTSRTILLLCISTSRRSSPAKKQDVAGTRSDCWEHWQGVSLYWQVQLSEQDTKALFNLMDVTRDGKVHGKGRGLREIGVFCSSNHMEDGKTGTILKAVWIILNCLSKSEESP